MPLMDELGLEGGEKGSPLEVLFMHICVPADNGIHKHCKGYACFSGEM